MQSWSCAELTQLADEAAVGAYGRDEEIPGLFTMLREHLALPFATTVLGTETRVIGAICAHGKQQQVIGLLALPLPVLAPAGAQWIEAHRH
ncbi:hypothetical protein [Streptacidiphilus rugosus]|uniref:hypothetical protein n=1 Tax=Streptacidiphilus rugosus TaxID=405783 RepID=UPI00055F2A4D|nr:hypothetical protein [Streptacidiphilus rugosus]